MLANSMRIHSLRLNISYYELAIGNIHLDRRSLIKVTPLRAMRRFLKALNFSLDDFSCLMILASEK